MSPAPSPLIELGLEQDILFALVTVEKGNRTVVTRGVQKTQEGLVDRRYGGAYGGGREGRT